MQMVLLTDALDAMEANLRAFIKIAGKNSGHVRAVADSVNGTASINHETIYGNTINCTVRFPAMPGAARISRAELDRWTAYFLHELCHAFYTDTRAWREAVYAGLHQLVNGLEDVRIERKALKDAFASNFRALLTNLMAFVLERAERQGFNPNDLGQLPFVLAVAGRVEVCGYDLPAGKAMLAKLNPWTCALVSEAMTRLRRARSTAAVLDIARWIKGEVDTLKPATPGQPQGDGSVGDEAEGDEVEGDEAEGDEAEAGDKADQPKGGRADWRDEAEGDEAEAEGDEAEAGDKAEGDEAEGDKAEGDKAEGDEAEGDEAEAGDKSGKAEASDSAATGGKGEKTPRGGEADVVDSKPGHVDKFEPADLNPVSDKVAQESRDYARVAGPDGVTAEVTIIDAIRDAQRNAGGRLHGHEGGHAGSAIVAKLKRDAMACGRLRAQLAKVLKSEETEDWQHGRSAGRLDRFALGRIGAGAVDGVYAKRTVLGGYETEIIVLVDLSGSMGGGRAVAASTLALVIAQAAQQVGVKAEILSFNSVGGLRLAKAHNAMIGGGVAFGAMAGGTGGGTPLTGAMVKAAARLAARAAGKRKLMFVISDGGCDSGPRGVAKAAAYARRIEIETVGLVIDTPAAIHSGFDMAVHCDSGKVTETGLGALLTILSRHG